MVMEKGISFIEFHITLNIEDSIEINDETALPAVLQITRELLLIIM